MSRPVSRSATNLADDARLYLKESELDKGAALIRKAARQLRIEALTIAEEVGLLDAELDTLIELASMEGCDISQLREHMHAPKQSMARNLKALEKAQLVNRTPCPTDKRRRRLHLTDKGHGLVEDAAKGWRDVLSNAYRASGPDVVSNAKHLLHHITDANQITDEEID